MAAVKDDKRTNRTGGRTMVHMLRYACAVITAQTKRIVFRLFSGRLYSPQKLHTCRLSHIKHTRSGKTAQTGLPGKPERVSGRKYCLVDDNKNNKSHLISRIYSNIGRYWSKNLQAIRFIWTNRRISRFKAFIKFSNSFTGICLFFFFDWTTRCCT